MTKKEQLIWIAWLIGFFLVYVYLFAPHLYGIERN